MIRLADVMRRHGPSYLECHGEAILPEHRRAVNAILTCRTPELGAHVATCGQCGYEHLLYHSCHHRACPQCGGDRTARWLEQQRELLLPVPYFHVVFTLPSELRRVVRSNQRALLAVLFKAAFDTLSELCADPRHLGAQIGALAVLHTWTRTLEWHPHVHLLVPGGGLAPDGQTWIGKTKRKERRHFLVPVKALAKCFRGRFMHLARRALPNVNFPEIPWKKRWVVFAKPTVQGADSVLEYLGRYVHRTALSDRAILKQEQETVTFQYRDSRDAVKKTMTLPGQEFLRRFLQHVLPKGLHRVRAFGLLHPTHRTNLRRLQLLLSRRSPVAPEPVSDRATELHPIRCPKCGTGTLRRGRQLSPEDCALFLARPASDQEQRARAPPPPARA